MLELAGKGSLQECRAFAENAVECGDALRIFKKDDLGSGGRRGIYK